MKPHHNKLLTIDAKIYLVLLIFCIAVFAMLGVWWVAPFVALALTVAIHYLNYDVIELLLKGVKK